jgi:hypothetical protein
MTNGPGRFRALLIGAILAVSAPNAIMAQDSPQSESKFILLTAPEGAIQDEGYSDIISNFIRAALTGKGVMATLVTSEEDADAIRQMADAEDIAGLADLTLKKGSDFLLLTRYSLGASRIELEFWCLDAAQSAIVVSGQETASPLLLLDSAIAREVKQVVSSLQESLVVQSRPETAARDTVEPDTDAASPDEVVVGPPQVAVATPPAQASPDVKPGLFVSPSFGLFQTLGAAGEYFTSGIMPGVAVHHGFAMLGGRVSPGVSLGTIYFETSDDVVSSSSFLTPFAIDVQYTTASNGIMDFELYLAGGGALFSVSVDRAGFVSKIIPYVGGGMGFLFFQGSNLSLGINIATGAFLERPDPIVGYYIGAAVQLSQ